MSSGLLIVDVQNDFCEGGSLAVEGGTAVAQRITQHLSGDHGYRVIVTTQDWHRADSTNGGHIALPPAEPDYVTSWPVHCIQDTRGAELHHDLGRDQVTHQVRKGQGEHGYSAFDGRVSTGGNDAELLAGLLRDHRVDHLDVVGLATDHCVLASARDALAGGWSVRVLTDLVAGVGAESSAAALVELQARGAALV